MFGLSRDFIQQDGISMQLGNPDGLTAAQLNMVQARMLMNTGIPHHLRLLLREVDLQVTLEYAVSRRKMLSHLLKSERLSMPDFFGLLLQIARGMEEGKLYMLRAEQYALHEDYIFVEGPLSSGKVYLTYIPLQSTGMAAAPGASIKSLIMVIMASVTELAGSGVQRVLQYCGSEDFTTAGLKDLLAELLADGIPVKGASGTTEPAPPDVPLNRAVPVTADTLIRQKPHVNEAGEAAAPRGWSFAQMQEDTGGADRAEASWMNSLPKLRLKEEEETLGSGEVRIDTDSPPSAYRTYVVLGAVLADALLWKFLYLNTPNTLWLIVSLIATVVLAVLSWLVWNQRIMLGRREGEGEYGEELEGEAGKANERWQSRKPKELEWAFGKKPVVPAGTAGTTAPPRSAQEPAAPVYPGSGDMRHRAGEDRQPPAAEAATALLTRSNAPGAEREPDQQTRATPYLERSQADEGGTPERIELTRASFIIGRSPEVAQYVEKSEGVSRVHAEISRGPGGYILKDLDSRNGTLYQGDPMIPYKEYPLAEGSIFTIVKGCYTFRSA